MQGIAVRRHHRYRLKAKRKKHFGRDMPDAPKKVWGQVIDTPTPCSCYMCGNPRKWFKEKTVQEKKADLQLRDD